MKKICIVLERMMRELHIFLNMSTCLFEQKMKLKITNKFKLQGANSHNLLKFLLK